MASPRSQSQPHQQQIFSDESDVERSSGRGEYGSDTNTIDIRPRGPFRGRSSRAVSTYIAGSHGSLNQTPARSYVQRYFHAPSGSSDLYPGTTTDVRGDTAELASRAIEDGPTPGNSSRYRASEPGPSSVHLSLPEPALGARKQQATSQRHDMVDEHRPEVIEEVPEPATPAAHSLDEQRHPEEDMQGTLLLQEQSIDPDASGDEEEEEEDEFAVTVNPAIISQPHERTPLLKGKPRQNRDKHDDREVDPESLKARHGRVYGEIGRTYKQARWKAQQAVTIASHPKSWDIRAIVKTTVVQPASYLPAVILGLLLNVLDALSYGMILFPLGTPIFEGLGSDGLSMFYVSCIVSQLVYSCGGSVFRGAIGSEMIEVVPFFHNMAFAIVDHIGEDKPHAILATTILAYAISSVVTGLAFFLLGQLKLGRLIGFFPRHILIGCIGGVGFFLVVTGIEVSARLDGNLEYSLRTLRKLFEADTAPLWTIPLALALVLLVAKRWVKFAYTDAVYFISTIAIFYIVVASVPQLNLSDLREKGWVFDAPDAGQPWYHFYTLYDFKAVDWGALAQTIPAMLALTFFGLLHVPINVPALALTMGEDNLDLDRELRAHGYSNALSGLCGSIQNYLVYTNTVLFMRGGGDSRLAGMLLACATFGILFIGPVIIGYVPIMVVGALIFYLGFDLLREALIDTWSKAGKLEFLTIVIIVLVMGIYDFVVGIGVGIILACVSFVLQSSQISAVRGTVPGGIANSTVRRHPVQRHYLHQVGTQIYVMRLAGFLFFGTIVGVENEIRKLLEDERFKEHPISYLVLDLSKVDGVDFSAAEAFTRINRILERKDVHMVMCGFTLQSSIGKSLVNVGLLEEDEQIGFFDALNPALEYCENEMLKTFYQRREALMAYHRESSPHAQLLDIPNPELERSLFPLEMSYNSPRRGHMHKAAAETLLEQQDPSTQQKWQRYTQPLQLVMQTLSPLVSSSSSHDESFWSRLVPFLARDEWAAGATLYEAGTPADAFYLLQSGVLKAKYQLPQGSFSEVIVAGATCGELPFFGETARTSTTVAERESVTWVLRRERWEEMQEKEPELAREMLKICLKLTTERLDSITKYMLLMGA